MTPHTTQVIGPGTINDPASYALIDAEGSKVAVAWFRCNALHARVSNDHGQTWGPTRKLLDTASCDGDFASFSDDMITSKYHPEHLVGYVKVAGVTKLAAAFERPGVIRFRRQT